MPIATLVSLRRQSPNRKSSFRGPNTMRYSSEVSDNDAGSDIPVNWDDDLDDKGNIMCKSKEGAEDVDDIVKGIKDLYV